MYLSEISMPFRFSDSYEAYLSEKCRPVISDSYRRLSCSAAPDMTFVRGAQRFVARQRGSHEEGSHGVLRTPADLAVGGW